MYIVFWNVHSLRVSLTKTKTIQNLEKQNNKNGLKIWRIYAYLYFPQFGANLSSYTDDDGGPRHEISSADSEAHVIRQGEK